MFVINEMRGSPNGIQITSQSIIGFLSQQLTFSYNIMLASLSTTNVIKRSECNEIHNYCCIGVIIYKLSGELFSSLAGHLNNMSIANSMTITLRK